MAKDATTDEALARIKARKEVGAWLRQRREEAGLSQSQLAERLAIGYYAFISQIEAGRGKLPLDRCKDWAEALQMNPRDFAKTILSYYEPALHDVLFGAPED